MMILSALGVHFDAKAQGTVAIAGIFLASVFAFVRDLGADVAPVVSWSLVIATVLLLACVGSAAWSLRIRKIPRPPLGEDTQTLVKDLMSLKESNDLGVRIPRMYNDLSGRWATVNSKIYEATKSKAGGIFAAQFMLFLAVLVVGFMTIGTVLAIATL